MQDIENSGIFTALNKIHMQRHHFISIVIALLSVIGFTSCNKTLNTTTDTDMSLSVYGGTTLEVVDGDLSRDIIVACSSPAQEDIIVNLEAVADQREAELASSQVTIKKGTKTADGKITFKLAAFPEKTPAKIILVRISTRTPNVNVESASTEFTVGGYIPLVLEAKTNGTEFNTFNGEVKYTITLTLTKAMEEDLSIRFRVKTTSSPIFIEALPNHSDTAIKAGDLSVVQTYTLPQGTEGTLETDILTTDNELEVTTTDFTAVFTATEGTEQGI